MRKLQDTSLSFHFHFLGDVSLSFFDSMLLCLLILGLVVSESISLVLVICSIIVAVADTDGVCPSLVRREEQLLILFELRLLL